MISSLIVSHGQLTRRVMLATAVVACLCPRTSRADVVGEAKSFIREMGERAITILNANGRDPAARRAEMAALLDEAVDVELIARLALGRHWRTTSEPQRNEYVDLFRAYLLSGLSAQLGGAGGERFIVKGSHLAREEDSVVGTQVVLAPDQPPIDVDWRVRHEGNQYKIVDVIAQGVSLVVTNRAEFDAIIARRGLDGLLEQMRRWRDEAATASPA
jgi:phospholipid transport system substrate-binding protein